MRDGSFEVRGDRAAIRFERDLPAPPTEVWRAITDRHELESWFPCDVFVDTWAVGEAIVFRFPGHGDMTLNGTVLEVDQPRLLVYTWGEETLRFELHPSEDGGTHLVLVDELDRPSAARNAAGWEVCLERLLGRVPGDDLWRHRFEHYGAVFQGLFGAQLGPPPGFEDG